MIVTLLTDFGTADYFVGAMKGAVLAVNPEAQLVDITHEIPPHDVDAGAFTLLAAFSTFPAGTIHIGVVDPGVGSARRAIVVDGGGHLFVGPDNGLFGLIFERLPDSRVFHATARELFRPNPSSTFHGRDLFAPLAGALSRGLEPEAVGERIADFQRLPFKSPKRSDDETLEASIIHIDRFGNCITNITPGDLSNEDIRSGARVIVGGREIARFFSFFAESDDGEPFAIWGSAGLLELAVNRDSAARVLSARRGQGVKVSFHTGV